MGKRKRQGNTERLTPDELVNQVTLADPQTQKKLKAVLGHFDKSEDTVGGDALRSAYDNLSRVIKSIPPWPAFSKMRHAKKFEAGMVVVEEFITEYFPDLHARQEIHLQQILFKTLITQLREDRIPVSVRTISEHLRRIPEVVDMQFPGYREAGLLGFILHIDSK